VTAALPESTYAVLGLVDKVPDSSGYDLAAVTSSSLDYFWPLSRTLLYRELERLADLGWVTACRVDQSNAPTKWTYRATTAGRRALSAWLRRLPTTDDTTRNPVLLRIFFSHRMSTADTVALLDTYRSQLGSRRDELVALVEKLEGLGTPSATAGWLAALHGLRTTQARLDWTDEVEEMLAESDRTGGGR
jgi:DNA-binding PadR family transcriptional regulator